VETFIDFLRELHDVDALRFFLHARAVTQVELGLSFKTRDKTPEVSVTQPNQP
jgi:hypothetical protein